MAERFAYAAVSNLERKSPMGDGGAPVIVKIYVRNFGQMRGLKVENKPSVNWNHIKPDYITDYDYLWSEIDGYVRKYQIKFNPSAYPFLKANEVLPVR